MTDTPNWFGGFNPTVIGYNTTAGGDQFLGYAPTFSGDASLTFDFAASIDSFGSYIMGLESNIDGDLFVTYTSGVVVALNVPEFVVGGSQFFGFVDRGASISSVTLELRDIGPLRDIIGIDDLRWGRAPEPTTLFTLGTGLLLLVGFRRRS